MDKYGVVIVALKKHFTRHIFKNIVTFKKLHTVLTNQLNLADLHRDTTQNEGALQSRRIAYKRLPQVATAEIGQIAVALC